MKSVHESKLTTETIPLEGGEGIGWERAINYQLLICTVDLVVFKFLPWIQYRIR